MKSHLHEACVLEGEVDNEQEHKQMISIQPTLSAMKKNGRWGGGGEELSQKVLSAERRIFELAPGP